jgi:hypothetical protein
MGGESLNHASLTIAGLEGNRLYAFENTDAPSGILRLYFASVTKQFGMPVFIPRVKGYQ